MVPYRKDYSINILESLKAWIRHKDGSQIHDFTGDGDLTAYLLANRRGETAECPKLRRILNKHRRHLEKQRAKLKGEVISIKQQRSKKA